MIPEYICLFLMSFSLQQYFRNMMPGRKTLFGHERGLGWPTGRETQTQGDLTGHI